MITSQLLSTIVIERVIFHDIPRNPRGGDAQPTLAEDQTEVDAVRKQHLKTRLIRALGSKTAYPVCFKPDTGSPVPNHVRSFTAQHSTLAAFVTMSQSLGNYLFEQQHGGISSGLLCVVAVSIGGRQGIVIMKLEREEGARLELERHRGRRAYSMSVLDNLVLTDGTRLFKSALFLRTGPDSDDFDSLACDTQLNVAASHDMARFWLRFLGCEFVVEPRVATERFYESAVSFINDSVADPVHKNDLYEHLQSQLKAPQRNFSPRAFIENYVPEAYQRNFQNHLAGENIPLNSFQKDLADVSGKLRRRAYRTARGAIVSAPADEVNLVNVTEDQIIVNDPVLGVDNR